MRAGARDALAPPRLATGLAVVGLVVLLLPVVAIGVAGGVEHLPRALGSRAVWTAIGLTAWTSLLSTLVAVLVGVPLALVAERGRAPLSWVAGVTGELPLVIPPVVTGLGLLLAFGRNGMLGGVLDAAGLQLTFTSAAVVLAQVIVAVPLVVLAVRAGIAAMDPLPELVAAVHGAGPLRRSRLATLPALRGPIVLGAALGWGRAAGEFGATLTFAGSLPGRTRTLPLEVFAELQREPRVAAAAALLQLLLAAAVLIAARSLRRTER